MRKLSRLIILILILGIGLYVAHPFILEGMAGFLIVQDKLEKADVIVVLGGDSNGERVNEGVNLYKKGYAKYLLMSGGPLAWQLTYGQWMKKQAEYLGVPAKFILIEDKSESTIENAKFTLPILKKKNFKSAIVISSPYHMFRLSRVFQKIYKPQGIKVTVYPVQNSEFNPHRWWTRHEDTGYVVWEYVSLVLYFLRGY